MHDLLFDMDGTLYDFKKSESVCLEKVFSEADIAYTDEMIALYQSVNHRLWDEYEKGLVSQSYVENERMQLFFDEIGCRKDGHKAASDYVEYLSQTDFMIDGARDFLERIKDNRRLFIITNGIAKTQYGRLRNSLTMDFYDRVFISGEIGLQKPEKAFFDHVMKEGGISRENAIVIGDSEKSDIMGARNAGMKSIFISFDRKKSSLADYSVSTYEELYSLIVDLDKAESNNQELVRSN